MNGLSDSLTIGLVLALVFGALFFYIYSRIGQVEKRVSLTENILLDLKMATENTLMSMTAAAHDRSEEDEHSNIHIQAVSGPEPLPSEDVEQIPDEAYYKSVLQSAAASSTLAAVTESTAADDNGSVSEKARLDVNYESMTLKELKALAKQRGINATGLVHKKDFIDALKRQGQPQAQGSVLEPVPGSQGVSTGGLEEGFPVDLGSALPA